MSLRKLLLSLLSVSLIATTTGSLQLAYAARPTTQTFLAFRGGDFLIDDGRGRTLVAKVALSPSGDVFECFDVNPSHWTGNELAVKRVRFAGKLHFCTPGFALMEKAGFEHRILGAPAPLLEILDDGRGKAKKVGDAARFLGGGSTDAQICHSEAMVKGRASHATPVFPPPSMRKTASQWPSDSTSLATIANDPDDPEFTGFDDLDLPDGWANVIGSGWASSSNNSMCNSLLRAMLVACIGSGPAYEACVLAAVVVYLACLAGG